MTTSIPKGNKRFSHDNRDSVTETTEVVQPTSWNAPLPPTSAYFVLPTSERDWTEEVCWDAYAPKTIMPMLPGRGEPVTDEVLGVTCKKPIRPHQHFSVDAHVAAVCERNPEEDSKRTILKTCHRLECPMCHRDTLTRNSEEMASVVNGYRMAVRMYNRMAAEPIGSDGKSPRHVTCSLDKDEVIRVIRRTLKSLKREEKENDVKARERAFLQTYRRAIYRHIKALNIEAASVTIHMWRLNSMGKERYIEERKEKDGKEFNEDHDIQGLAIWEWARKQEDFLDIIHFSPHAHLLAYGENENTSEYYEKTGFFYRVIREIRAKRDKTSGAWLGRDDKPVSFDEALKNSIQYVCYYILSHTQVIKGKVSWTKFGGMAPSNMNSVWDIDKIYEECPECAKEGVVSYRVKGYVTDDTDEFLSFKYIFGTPEYEPVYTKHKVWWFWFRGEPIPSNLTAGAVRRLEKRAEEKEERQRRRK